MEQILRLVRADRVLDRDAVMKGLVVAYLLLVPMMWSPLPFNMQWADVVFLAVGGLFLATGMLRSIALVSLDYLVLAYVICSFASLINSGDSLEQGVECLKLAYLGVVYVILGAWFADRPMRIRLARWTVWAAASVSLVGVSYSIFSHLLDTSPEPLATRMLVPYLGEVLRLKGTLTTPELLGNYLAYAIPFALGLAGSFQDKRARWWVGGGLSLITVAEIFTFSHSWVGFVCAGLVFGWSALREHGWNLVRYSLLAGAIGLFLAMLFVSTVYVNDTSMRFTRMPAAVEPVPHHVSRSGGDSWPTLTVSVTYDYLAYHVLKVLAWEAFLDHPLFGVGLGNFDAVVREGIAQGRLNPSFGNLRPHMTVLGQLAETGLLGGGTLIALWTGGFLLGWQVLRSDEGTDTKWIVRASLAGLAGLFINGIYTDVMHFRFLWIDLALLRGIAISSASKAEAAL